MVYKAMVLPLDGIIRRIEHDQAFLELLIMATPTGDIQDTVIDANVRILTGIGLLKNLLEELKHEAS